MNYPENPPEDLICECGRHLPCRHCSPMKERKLTLKIMAARPGVPAEEVEITNHFPDEEAMQRFHAMMPVVLKMAEIFMANERPIHWPEVEFSSNA